MRRKTIISLLALVLVLTLALVSFIKWDNRDIYTEEFLNSCTTAELETAQTQENSCVKKFPGNVGILKENKWIEPNTSEDRFLLVLISSMDINFPVYLPITEDIEEIKLEKILIILREKFPKKEITVKNLEELEKFKNAKIIRQLKPEKVIKINNK